MGFFSTRALELAPWSVSKADTAVKCPLKFQHQYAHKTTVPADKQPVLSDTALKVGSAAHFYAELLAKGVGKESADKRVLAKHALLSTEVEELGMLLAGVEDFQERVEVFKKAKGFTQDLIEKKMAVDKDLSPVDYWDNSALFRWIVDRALLSSDGKYAIILDIKTGKSPSLKWSRDQLDAYVFGAMAYWPTVTMVQCALYFVPDRQLLWDEQKWRKDFTVGETTPTVVLINTAAEEAGSTEHREGKHCSWCPYSLICPKVK